MKKQKRNTIRHSSIQQEHWNDYDSTLDQESIFKIKKDQKMKKLLTQAIGLTSVPVIATSIEIIKKHGIEQKKKKLLEELNVLFDKFEEETRRCKNEIINTPVYQKRKSFYDKIQKYSYQVNHDQIINESMKTNNIIDSCDKLYREIERGIKNG